MRIKGKEYVEVKDRIIKFNKDYPKGFITTEIISQTDDIITMKATVTPDSDQSNRIFTGTAQEWKNDPRSMVNKTSFVENCETSAVGRALALMGIGVIDSIASAEEVMIAKNKEIRERVAKAEKVFEEKDKKPMDPIKEVNKRSEEAFTPKVYGVKDDLQLSK